MPVDEGNGALLLVLVLLLLLLLLLNSTYGLPHRQLPPRPP